MVFELRHQISSTKGSRKARGDVGMRGVGVEADRLLVT